MAKFIQQGSIVQPPGEKTTYVVLAAWQGWLTLKTGDEAILTKHGSYIGSRYTTKEVLADMCTVIR